MSDSVLFRFSLRISSKSVLLKPGAEKLCRLFNLYPQLELIQSITDFDKPLFHYHYRCTIYRHGEPIGQSDGCCNSREKKYEKQQYKVYDLVNTITKISQKRAMVSAVLVAVGASEFFTVDLDETCPQNRNELMEQTTREVKRLKWTSTQASSYLQKTYGKPTRAELTDVELQSFLEYLQNQS